MPTYEYECVKCGNRFEYFQGMKDEPLTTCPDCSSSLKRLIGSGAGIIFSAKKRGGSAYGGKGSGFYATDYKTKKPKREENTCPQANKNNPACSSCSKNDDSK